MIPVLQGSHHLISLSLAAIGTYQIWKIKNKDKKAHSSHSLDSKQVSDPPCRSLHDQNIESPNNVCLNSTNN